MRTRRGEGGPEIDRKSDGGTYRWELFVPLHRLWCGYMSELLPLSASPANGSASPMAMPMAVGMHAKLVKADFHGSIVTGACVLFFFAPAATRNNDD